jgi:hypothetical protein
MRRAPRWDGLTRREALPAGGWAALGSFFPPSGAAGAGRRGSHPRSSRQVRVLYPPNRSLVTAYAVQGHPPGVQEDKICRGYRRLADPGSLGRLRQPAGSRFRPGWSSGTWRRGGLGSRCRRERRAARQIHLTNTAKGGGRSSTISAPNRARGTDALVTPAPSTQLSRRVPPLAGMPGKIVVLQHQFSCGVESPLLSERYSLSTSPRRRSAWLIVSASRHEGLSPWTLKAFPRQPGHGGQAEAAPAAEAPP